MGRRRGRTNVGLVILIVVVICCCCLVSSTTAGAATVTTLGGQKNAGPTGPNYPTGRYVKLQQTTAYDGTSTDNKYKIINLAELEVFDENDKKISHRRPVTVSSGYGGANLTDGSFNNLAQTNAGDQRELDWMMVDLGSEHKIKTLLITNGTNCCKERAIGIRAIVLDANKKTVKSTPAIVIVEDSYEFVFDESKGWSRPGGNET